MPGRRTEAHYFNIGSHRRMDTGDTVFNHQRLTNINVVSFTGD